MDVGEISACFDVLHSTHSQLERNSLSVQCVNCSSVSVL